jgi:hypothetical protein
MEMPAGEMLPARALDIQLSCPRVAAVLRCPSSRSVGVFLSHVTCCASVQAHRHACIDAGCRDTKLTMDVEELLVLLLLLRGMLRMRGRPEVALLHRQSRL